MTENIKMNVEEINDYFPLEDGWEDGTYLNAKISFKCGGTVLKDEFLEELADLIGCTWNADDVYKVGYGENSISLIIDNDYWDPDYEKLGVDEEMIHDAENVFIKQIIEDKDVYGMYYKIFQDYLIKNNHEKQYDNTYISEAAHYFEEGFEECSVAELLSISEKELEEEILADIREDFE